MILAIDPGNTHSAWVSLADERTLCDFGKVENAEMLSHCRSVLPGTTVVIEKIASYGMAVGAEVFETVFWSGKFAEAAEAREVKVVRIPRLEVKLQMCRDSRAKDANIRQALIDRWGGIQQTKKGGALHGVSKDVWQALAVGVTYLETRKATL